MPTGNRVRLRYTQGLDVANTESGKMGIDTLVRGLFSGRTARVNARVEALLRAAEAGDGEALDALLREGVSPDALDSRGRAALCVAVEAGNLPCVLDLLAAGAKVDARAHRSFGGTALHCAARLGNLNIANALIRGGARLDALDTTGSSPLHVAAHSGRPEMVSLLLVAGADVAARDQFGNTPLMVAAGPLAEQTIKKLLAAGAPLDAVNVRGESALDHALNEAAAAATLAPGAQSHLRYVAIARTLIEAGGVRALGAVGLAGVKRLGDAALTDALLAAASEAEAHLALIRQVSDKPGPTHEREAAAPRPATARAEGARVV